MFHGEIINTATAIGFWSAYGRLIFIAIYSVIILLLIIFLIKKKIDKKKGIISVVCVFCMLLLMFVATPRKTVFNPDELTLFFNDLDGMLTLENVDMINTNDDSVAFAWHNKNEDIDCYVSVKERGPQACIDKDSPEEFTVRGQEGEYEYLFAPMFARSYSEHFGLVRYTGKLFLQSDEYFVNVTYMTYGDDLIDYISVIYPILYNKDISIMELLEKTDNDIYMYELTE